MAPGYLVLLYICYYHHRVHTLCRGGKFVLADPRDGRDLPRGLTRIRRDRGCIGKAKSGLQTLRKSRGDWGYRARGGRIMKMIPYKSIHHVYANGGLWKWGEGEVSPFEMVHCLEQLLQGSRCCTCTRSKPQRYGLGGTVWDLSTRVR